MDAELKTYQKEVEFKFSKSQMRHYVFPRISISTAAESKPPSASSKDILSKLLIKYQQLQSKPQLKSKKLLRASAINLDPERNKLAKDQATA